MPKLIFKHFINLTMAVVLTFGLSLSLQALLAATWVAPDQPPPDTGLSGVIYTSDTATQVISSDVAVSGALGAASGLSVTGNASISGSLGIGDDTPGAKLDVADTGVVDREAIMTTRETHSFGLGVDSGGSYWGGSFYVDGVKKMTIDSNGGVMIGSSVVGTAGPDNGLIVEGDVCLDNLSNCISDWGDIVADNPPTLQEVTDNGASTDNPINISSTARDQLYLESNNEYGTGLMFINNHADNVNEEYFGIEYGGGDSRAGRLSFWYAGNNAGYASRILTLDNSGNVGIGNVSNLTWPAYGLEVEGTFDLDSGVYKLTSDTTSSDLYALTLNRGTVDLWPASGNLSLGRDSSNQDLVISSAGNIGIGETTPDSKLQVNGAGRFDERYHFVGKALNSEVGGTGNFPWYWGLLKLETGRSRAAAGTITGIRGSYSRGSSVRFHAESGWDGSNSSGNPADSSMQVSVLGGNVKDFSLVQFTVGGEQWIGLERNSGACCALSNISFTGYAVDAGSTATEYPQIFLASQVANVTDYTGPENPALAGSRHLGNQHIFDGNVGIGDTAPAAKLSVNGGAHIGGSTDPGDNHLMVDGRLVVRDGTTWNIDNTYGITTPDLYAGTGEFTNLCIGSGTGNDCKSSWNEIVSAGGLWELDGINVNPQNNSHQVGVGTDWPEAKLEVFNENSATYTFKFRDSAGKQMVMDEAGNVGIGVSAPNRQLHVGGNGILLENGTALYGRDTDDDIRALIFKNSDNDTRIYGQNYRNTIIGYDNPVVIDYNGKVSLDQLTVNTNDQSTETDIKLGANANIATDNNMYFWVDSANNGGDRFYFRKGAGYGAGTDLMTIYNNGNLSIAGTLGGDSITDNTIDSSEVQIDSLTADDLAAGSVGTSEVIDNSLTVDDLGTGSVGSGEVIDNSLGAIDLADNSVGNAEMIDNPTFNNIIAGGYIDVSGYINDSVDDLVLDDWVDLRYAIKNTKTTAVTGQANAGWLFVNDSLEVEGEVEADSFLYSSDIRLKEDITPIKDALFKINELGGVEFVWKEDGEKSVGLIAQELEKVFPELVHTSEGSGLKTVNYGQLTAPIIEAIKELTEQNREQEARIRELEEKLKDLPQ